MIDPRPQPALELPQLTSREFSQLMRAVLSDPNLGAGIVATGVSGSGKSNCSLWAIQQAAEMGIPFIHIDPHGDAARQAWKMCLKLPRRLRNNIIYWRVADPHAAASINPLADHAQHDTLSEYQRLSQARIQVELTASIILAAVGEGAQGFAARPVLRKWVTRWLWMLKQSGLTLADAAMLIDPHHPLYPLLVQLAPDEMSRIQMEALPGMKVSDLEAEIGSARNRIATILEHPAATVLLSRRHNTLDFQQIYRQGTSLIVDLDRGELLSEEVQRLIANIVLTQYLAVVMSTPLNQRQRRLCVIDELPVFNESCAPLLERMCTEIRKYQTSFLFLHQGGSRFPGRTSNEFLQTIHDMCRVKLYFRHNMDAEFFGKQIALAAHQGPRVKHVQTTPQQFTTGHEIVELMDQGTGTSEMEGQTVTDGTTSQLTETLSTAVENADQRTRATADGQSNSHAQAQQKTSTRTTNVTYKQTLIPKLTTQQIVTGVQFYSKEEIEWTAAATVKELRTGEAIVLFDGVGIWQAMTPLAVDPLSHAPKYAARKLKEWHQSITSRPEFAAPTIVQQERREFLEALAQELQTLSYCNSSHADEVRKLTNGRTDVADTPDATIDRKEEGDAPWSI